MRPDVDRLNSRPTPEWFDAAKFGIFIHWGVWSIPAFAPRLGSFSDAFRADYDRGMAMIPYTEWYRNAIKIPGTPSARFHAEQFHDAPYEAFRDPFLGGLGEWDPAAWAQAFRDAGAGYVVLVTKHHDGFCLWPSGVANPHQANWTSPRDLVGELAAAVRSVGLKFGLYYSGGADWTFNSQPIRTIGEFLGSTPRGDYLSYAEAQVRELIDRYKPSVLWNDIGWPTHQNRLNTLFADYYDRVSDGVVNDRWRTPNLGTELIRLGWIRRLFDWVMKRRLRSSPDAMEGFIPPVVPHSDFRTPEYARFPDIQEKKWEATRGMNYSFGYNRADREEDYTSVEELLFDFIDGVSKNGNLLLNVGPDAAGRIPEPQIRRLKAFGEWLRANGEAIYGTRPWTRADAVTADGCQVRFTRKGDDLYLIVLGTSPAAHVTVRDLVCSGTVTRLADGAVLELEQRGGDLTLSLPSPSSGLAPAFRISGALA